MTHKLKYLILHKKIHVSLHDVHYIQQRQFTNHKDNKQNKDENKNTDRTRTRNLISQVSLIFNIHFFFSTKFKSPPPFLLLLNLLPVILPVSIESTHSEQSCVS